MKKLFSFLKDYKKESISGPLFKLLEATLELIVPLVVASIIDKGIAEKDNGYIVSMCLLLVGLGLAGLICSVTAQFFAAKASAGFVKKIRHALYEHIQGFSYRTLDKIGTSTLITRMTSDTSQVQTGLNLALRLLLRSPFVVFGAMIMAFTIDAGSAMWFAIAIPLLAVVVFGIMLISIPMYKKVQGLLDNVLGMTRENLTGVRVIRAFGKEDEEITDFEQKNGALASAQKLVGKISALMNPVTYVMINIAVILLLRTDAVRVYEGALTQGQVVALYNYMSQILVELIKLADLIINITKSVACGKRILAVLDIPSGEEIIKDLPGGDKSVKVCFKNAGISYSDGAEKALCGIDLNVMPGETVGVIGGTGSGKTTLVNLIPRFYDVTEGQVLIEGKDVRSLPQTELRAKIGVVPQKSVLFRGSIRDNLKWGNENADDKAIMQAVLTAQAEDVIKAKGGLDAVIEQSGKNLSGGQRQRLAIARALVRRPEILILDDSSSALDYATDAALRASLKDLDYSPVVFIVSQRTSSVRHADKIVVLDDGKCVGTGSHDELLKSCSVYREIYDSQFKKEVDGNEQD